MQISTKSYLKEIKEILERYNSSDSLKISYFKLKHILNHIDDTHDFVIKLYTNNKEVIVIKNCTIENIGKSFSNIEIVIKYIENPDKINIKLYNDSIIKFSRYKDQEHSIIMKIYY